VAEARKRWKAGQASLDPRKLVFVDETGTNTKMVKAYGRCPQSALIGRSRSDTGRPPLHRRPPMRWHHRALGAGWADEPRGLPRLHRQGARPTLSEGDIVVMDNLPATRATRSGPHRATGARLLLLPPYSPDLNPSSWHSQSSRLSCERQQSEPSAPFGTASASSSTPSPKRNAQLFPSRRLCVNLTAECSRPSPTAPSDLS